MNKDDVSIWLPIYIGDILAMSTRLNTEQVGGLFLLMMDYWKNGAIPNDIKIIGAITHLSVAKAKDLIKSLLKIGVFFNKDNELISNYLDDKKSEATDNKKVKSEKAQKAANARWGKATQENNQENQAIIEHNSSNAQAMHKHNPSNATSNAPNMLEQCPSPSPSPSPLTSPLSSVCESESKKTENIKPTHTNENPSKPILSEKAKQQNSQSEKIKQQNAQNIVDWQAPTLDEIRQKLMLAGFTGIFDENKYRYCIDGFKSHWESKSLEGRTLNTQSERVMKLVSWIMNEKTLQKTKPTFTAKTDPLNVNTAWYDMDNQTATATPAKGDYEFISGEMIFKPFETQA